MSRSISNFKKEFGKTCNTGFMTTIIAMFVTPKVTGNSIDPMDYIALGIVALIFWLLGFILLSENKPVPKSVGKWKRIKVKKDTTIHIMEEAE